MITTELPNHKGRIYGESRMDWEKGKMVGELHGVLLHDNLRHPSDPCIQMEYDLATGTLTIRAWNDRNKSPEPLHVWTLPDQMFVETCGGDHAASFYLRTGYFDFTCSEDPAVPGIRMAIIPPEVDPDTDYGDEEDLFIPCMFLEYVSEHSGLVMTIEADPDAPDHGRKRYWPNMV